MQSALMAQAALHCADSAMALDHCEDRVGLCGRQGGGYIDSRRQGRAAGG
jgi:hypothetical protein